MRQDNAQESRRITRQSQNQNQKQCRQNTRIEIAPQEHNCKTHSANEAKSKGRQTRELHNTNTKSNTSKGKRQKPKFQNQHKSKPHFIIIYSAFTPFLNL